MSSKIVPAKGATSGAKNPAAKKPAQAPAAAKPAASTQPVKVPLAATTKSTTKSGSGSGSGVAAALNSSSHNNANASAVGASSVEVSSRRLNVGKIASSKPGHPRVLVHTDAGELDLTPLRLAPTGQSNKRTPRGMGDSSHRSFDSSAVFDPMASHRSHDSRGAHSTGSRPLSRNSSFDGSQSGALSDGNESDATSQLGIEDALSPAASSAQADAVVVKKKWTDAELDELLTVELQESDTQTVLVIAALSVATDDTAIHSAVTARNAAYKKLLDERPAKDIYSHRAAQTTNNALKEKEVMTAPAAVRSTGVLATTWDIHDSHELSAAQAAAEADANSSLQNAAQQRQAVTAQSGTHSISVGGDDPMDEEADGEGVVSASVDGDAGTRRKQALLHGLDMLERAVQQNTLHEQHLLYRDHAVTRRQVDADSMHDADDDLNAADDEAMAANHPLALPVDDLLRARRHLEPRLGLLWSFHCDATKGRSVTAMDFNRLNQDLLATAYGEQTASSSITSPGLICLWTLKNPDHPERIIRTRTPVTSLDFCTEHAHLLAAGFADGSVAVYDIREQNADDRPSLESQFATGKHAAAVTDLKWSTRGNERVSTLTSASVDGTIKQWSMKKGLVPTDIMTLKRVPNQAQTLGQLSTDGVISRAGAAVCFDYTTDDQSQYVVGTEDGVIHKCSVSYSEQVLENFFGHTGTINQVCFSVFLFLSGDLFQLISTFVTDPKFAVLARGILVVLH
jgi:hypothetical protein